MKYYFLLLLLSFHLLILANTQFTAWPEMLSFPYLLANKFTPYKDFILPYTPLLPVILNSFFNHFGFSFSNLKYLTWFFILATDLLVFINLWRIQKNILSLIFLGGFILLQPFLDGNMLWFDMATLPFLLLGFYFAKDSLNNQSAKPIFLTSLFLVLAALIKQTAIIYLIIYVGFLSVKSKNVFESLKWVMFAILIATLPLLAYLISNGSLNQFFLWTFWYPFTQWSKYPGYVDFNLSKRDYFKLFLFLLPLIVSLISSRKILKDKINLLNLFFVGGALLAIYPRFSYFHFQPALALVVICYFQIYSSLSNKLHKKIFLLLVFFVLIGQLLLLPAIKFDSDIRFSSDETKLADQIKQDNSEKTVYLMGPSSSIYVLSNKLPPKKWADNFGWYLEIDGVADWVISGLASDPPRRIYVTKPLSGNWYDLGVYQSKKIVDYIHQYYFFDGEINNTLDVWTRK